MSKANLLKKNGKQLYGALINKKVQKSHPTGDENALLRKAIYALGSGQPLPQEFLDYFQEVEGIKTETKEECGLNSTPVSGKE